MTTNWDLVAYNRNKQMTLITEFKSATDMDTAWVTEYRNNLLTYANLPSVPFFLVAMPDKGYLWHHHNKENNIPPTHIINLMPILKSHSPQQLNKNNLEMLFTTWLFQRIHQPIEQIPTDERWIIETGLYDAIKDGIIEEDGLLWQ